MKHIQSRDNSSYKHMSRLARGKQPGMTLLEGIHLCQAWLRYRGMPNLALFDAGRLRTSAELMRLCEALDTGLARSCDSNLMHGLSGVQHGQGVYFAVDIPQPAPPARIGTNCVWLDNVQDPGNVGTILRTSAAAGIDAVYLSTGCASAWSQKVLRSAQGAHFVLTIHEHADLPALHARCDVPLVVTALRDAQSLYRAALPEHCVWLFGNEGQGVGAALQERADMRVFIPQAPNVESLNVGVAAAVCLFEQRRRYPVPG
jgi:TrmH family RNA methyltransferase